MLRTIKRLQGIQIFDSRGMPTVKVIVELQEGQIGTFAVPSGASTGEHEKPELRDREKAYSGMGVKQACKWVGEIQSKLDNISVTEQTTIDKTILENFSFEQVGANCIVGISGACLVAASQLLHIPVFQHVSNLFETDPKLPIPMFNVINGGKHSGSGLPIQEIMIVPTKAATFEQAMQMGVETYQHLKTLISKKFGHSSIAVGDEGGFAPDVANTEQALQLVVDAITNAGYKNQIKLALDCAASEFYQEDSKKYNLGWKKATPILLTTDELGDKYIEWIERFGIISIEDPFEQNDFDGWARFTSKTNCLVVGDDLLVTSPERITKAKELSSCTALLLKPNQIGTFSGALQAAKAASPWPVIVSHRSGDTEDSLIADLAVGIGARLIKTGAPCRSERLCKYNRLIEIEELHQVPMGSINF